MPSVPSLGHHRIILGKLFLATNIGNIKITETGPGTQISSVLVTKLNQKT